MVYSPPFNGGAREYQIVWARIVIALPAGCKALMLQGLASLISSDPEVSPRIFSKSKKPIVRLPLHGPTLINHWVREKREERKKNFVFNLSRPSRFSRIKRF